MTSVLYANEHVIDDDTPDDHQIVAGNGFGRGFTGRDPAGYGAAATTFPTELLIPRSDWQGIIEEKEAKGTQHSQLAINAGLPCKNQQQTDFCWGNGTTHAEEVVRMDQNEPMAILSAASVCCPITGFQNRGGWGKDAIVRLANYGAVPESAWPANAISRQYYTPANLKLALPYKIVDWMSLEPRNIDQLVSLLLRNVPVPIGLNWWGHLVCAYDAVWLNNAIGIRPRNSWGMSYGHLGFFTLQGSKMIPDDAIAAYTARAAA